MVQTNFTQPFSSKIQSVELVDWAGKNVINILPQIVNLSTFESINEPLMRAELVITDMIDLFNNFPLIGEEFIIVIFEPEDGIQVSMPFFVEYVEKIQLEKKGTLSNYVLSLTNPLTLADSMTNVMHAYRGPVSKMVRSIFNDYIVDGVRQLAEKSPGFAYALSRTLTSTNPLTIPTIEESLGADDGVVCIPNMKPFHALQWLAAKSVPKNNQHSYDYKFFQSTKGFFFVTTHYLVKRFENPGLPQLPATDTSAKSKNIPYSKQSNARQYWYFGENAMVKDTNIPYESVIKNLYVHNRHKTTEKITSGYFQNMFFEINLARLQYKGRYGDLAYYKPATEKGGTLDTASFSGAIKNYSNRNGSIESNNRVAYFFNNREENEVQTPLMNFEEVWGNKERARVGFSQIRTEISIEGDNSLSAGDVIDIIIPSFAGFTEYKDDEQISGRYLVVGVKQFYFNTIHSTVLSLQKDVFQRAADTYQHKYGDTQSAPVGKDVSDPEYASKVFAAVKQAKESADKAAKLGAVDTKPDPNNPTEIVKIDGSAFKEESGSNSSGQ